MAHLIVFMEADQKNSSSFNFISFEQFAKRRLHDKNNQSEIMLARHFPKNRLNKSRNDLTYDEISDYFFCGCDKVYASRQSLQQHIKKVHNGNRPTGTLETNDEKHAFFQSKTNYQRSKQDNPLFQHLPKKQYNLFNDLYNPKRSKMFLNLHDQIAGQSKIETLSHPIFKQNIEKIRQDKCNRIPYLTSIDMAMTLYLVNLSHHVRPSFLLKTQQMLVITRHAINKHLLSLSLTFVNNGLYRSTKQVELKTQNSKQYSTKTNSEYVPLIVNHLIEKLIPRWKLQLNPTLLSHILQDFCTWLYDNGLTHLRLSSLAQL